MSSARHVGSSLRAGDGPHLGKLDRERAFTWRRDTTRLFCQISRCTSTTADASSRSPETTCSGKRIVINLSFDAGWLVSVFRYERSWNRWERHPNADELVTVMAGAVEFELDDGRRWSVSATEGASCVVPKLVWHRAVIAEPVVLMFITPAPALTEERPFG
jgi:hypothetical protein